MTQASVNDPAFPFLSRLAETVPAVVAACAASLPADAAFQDAKLVRHKRGRRCLVRYAFARAGGLGIGVFGKARAKRLDETGYRTQLALWHQGFGDDSADGISVAEPIGTVPSLNMWLQREAHGRMATEFLKPGADPAPMLRAAAALAKLHRADLPTGRQWTIADEMAMLQRRLLDAAAARPALREGILDVLCRCGQAAERLAEGTDTGVHRDFYPDQLLLDGERVTIVDFDLYARGDAAIDAGNFLAHITEFSLRRHGDPTLLASLEDAFLHRFLARSPAVSPEAVETYAALTLARHISISLAIPGRGATTAPLVRLSRERLDRLTGNRGSRRSGFVAGSKPAGPVHIG